MQPLKKTARAVILSCLIMATGIVGVRLGLNACFKHEPATVPTEASSRRASLTVLNLPLMIGVDDLRQALEENLPETYTDRDDDPTDLMVEDYIVYELERGAFDIQIIDQVSIFLSRCPAK